jgi:two-component system, OmpR family, alkaline phosphatase synthesis response regulator PhoP
MAEQPKWKILIADDNVQNVELIEAYLADIDCEVITTADGEETLEMARKAIPDLILLDIMMPKRSGFEVCRLLKGDPKTKEIAILMVTALREASDIERGVEVGTDDFISKPIHKQELLKRVQSLLNIRHYKNELQRTLTYIQSIESGNRP